MRFFHSFSSQPCLNEDKTPSEILYKNILYYATSLSYIKKNFPNIEIVLHTDKIAYEIMSILPYDEIYLSLEGKCLNKNLFASGKIESIKLENIDSVHIDGDVFLFKKEIIDFFDFNDCDVFIEYIESTDFYYPINNVYNKDILNNELLGGKDKAFSCGVLKFNNDKLKNDFIKNYDFFVNEYEKRGLQKCEYKTYDLFFEQVNLYELVNKNGLKFKTLYNDLNEYSIRKFGYIHKQSTLKYSDDNIESVKVRLLKNDANLYNNLINKINNLKIWKKI